MPCDTIRGWHKLFQQRGIEGLTSFEVGDSAVFLSALQDEALKAFVATTLPRSTRQVGAFIAQEFGLVYESRSRPIALLAARLPHQAAFHSELLPTPQSDPAAMEPEA